MTAVIFSKSPYEKAMEEIRRRRADGEKPGALAVIGDDLVVLDAETEKLSW